MPPGSLLRGLRLGQVQDATQALETLLHVLVVGGSGMQPAGIIWGCKHTVSTLAQLGSQAWAPQFLSQLCYRVTSC